MLNCSPQKSHLSATALLARECRKRDPISQMNILVHERHVTLTAREARLVPMELVVVYFNGVNVNRITTFGAN